MGIRLTANGHLEFLIADSSRTEVSITTDNPYADGSWHFVAAVRDGENGKLKIYIDGSPAATEVSDGGANIIGASDAFPSIGAGSWGGEFFSGLVDEVEIFNRSLSVQEIAAIYSAGSVGKCRPCAPSPSDLVSWWGGDDDALDLIGTNNGTLQGNATYAAGKVGQAFSFDGSGDYVSIPDQPSLNPTAAITVDAWIFSDNSLPFFPPIVKKAGVSSGYALELTGDGSSVNFWVYTGNSGWVGSPRGVVPTGIWTHVAGVYDGTKVSLYVNGQLIGSTSATGNITPSNSELNIGRDPGYPTKLFKGLIDEVEIFNRALAGEEIAAIYNAGATGKCSQKSSDGQSLRDGQWQCNRQRFKLFVEREQQWDLQRYLKSYDRGEPYRRSQRGFDFQRLECG